jgi:UDP-N-acetylenolpyruvoylglucosamine reductase
MTVTDKDAKDFQKMVDKLEKQNKKDKNKENEASIGSFFKSCLSADEKKKLDKKNDK